MLIFFLLYHYCYLQNMRSRTSVTRCSDYLDTLEEIIYRRWMLTSASDMIHTRSKQRNDDSVSPVLSFMLSTKSHYESRWIAVMARAWRGQGFGVFVWSRLLDEETSDHPTY